MKDITVSAIVKRFWKPITLAIAPAIGITAAIVSIGVSIDAIHIGDVNVHTTVSQVDNAGHAARANQSNSVGIDQVDIQLEDLEPCTTYEFQASLDPDFKDAETITFTTKCEED